MEQEQNDRIRMALRDVLRPLADLMVSEGVTLKAATEVLKGALYDSAQASGGHSDSQISLLTGLHRKDVRRLREEGPTETRAAFANAAARVIALWVTDPELQDKTGVPAELGRADFDALVRRVRADLASGTILSHLRDAGLVEEVGADAETALRLMVEAYLPRPGSDGMLLAFRKNVGAHLAAAVENVTGADAPRNFERAAHYNRLSPDSAQELEALARRLASEALTAFSVEAGARQQHDMSSPDATRRVSFGAYVFDQDIPRKEEDPS